MNTILIIAVIVLIAAGLMAVVLYRPKRPRPFESIYTDALNAIVRGDTKMALKLLRDVVRNDTNHLGAYLQMGEILRSEGKPDQAIKIHQSLTVRPNLDEQTRTDIHRALAQDFLQLDNLIKAKKEAEFVLKHDKKNIWALEFILDIAIREHDWMQAAKLAKEIQKITRQDDSHKLAQFQVYEGLDKMENDDRVGARACFLKALEIDNGCAAAQLQLGNLNEQKRDLVKAVDHWEQFAIGDRENAATVFAQIETALFDLGRYSEVEKFYRRLLEKTPDHLDALARLANVLEEKGERQQALELLDAALGQFEDSIHTHLMKLKLSLSVSPPHELSRQVDKIIDLVTSNKNRK